MKKFIKVICMCLALSMLLTLLLGNKYVGTIGEGCNKVKLYEYGDFIITEDNEIYDYSDQGLQKEYIIFPETINGKPTRMIYELTYWSSEILFFRKNTKTKKVYFPNIVDNSSYLCSVFVNKYCCWGFEDDLYRDYYYDYEDEKLLIRKMPICKIFDNSIDYDSSAAYLWDVYLNYEHIRMVLHDKFKNKPVPIKSSSGFHYFMANIEFMYNYENAPKQGYYWIDDLEKGETLSYIPENPTREGYTFGGWYADSECTIEYDFTTPYIKKDLVEAIDNNGEKYYAYPEDYVTYIYAKWIKN